MTSKLLIDDGNYDEWCEEDILKCYRDAAEHDDFIFGDCDYSYIWKNTEQNYVHCGLYT